jgi:hypothetical protein
MPGFNTLPAVGGGGGQANMTFVASVHMETYNRSWAQGGTPGYYAMYSTNQENGYVYFVGSTTTGGPLNRLINVTHSFTRIDIIAPQNDMVSLYKGKVKATTTFANPFSAFSSFPSTISSSGNFVLPNNALPLVNVLLVGGGGSGGYHSGGGGGGGGIVKLTAYQAVGTTAVTIGAHVEHGNQVQGNRTYFGNVYAIGGGGGGHYDNNGGTGANGGGGGGHHGYLTGGAGQTQTAGTGLGFAGTPEYLGGHRGGNTSWGGATWNHRGAGGGGGGGQGPDTSGTTGHTGYGAAHTSDISGSNYDYSRGGGGGSHSPGRNGDHGYNYGWGGGGGGSDHAGGNSHTAGKAGAVVVRYYIP